MHRLHSYEPSLTFFRFFEVDYRSLESFVEFLGPLAFFGGAYKSLLGFPRCLVRVYHFVSSVVVCGGIYLVMLIGGIEIDSFLIIYSWNKYFQVPNHALHE